MQLTVTDYNLLAELWVHAGLRWTTPLFGRNQGRVT